MVACCKDCYPHCDFCIHAEYFYLSLNGERIKRGLRAVNFTQTDIINHWRATSNIARTFIVTKRTQKRSKKLLFFDFS